MTISLLVACAGEAQTGPAIYSGGVVNPANNLDAYSVGLARGSLFSIYGNNLAPSLAIAAALPLPTLLNGVQVKVYAGTTLQEFDAPLLYVSPSLINAILPSPAPEGGGSVIVVVNGIQSNGGVPALITVTTSRFAAFARSQVGFGPAVLQQFDRTGVSLNGLTHPAAPGQTVMLWGTGLGPLPSGSDAAAPGLSNVGGNVVLSVGGVPVKPEYAGRAPTIPGVDAIKFNLPSSLPEGCYVPITVYVGGQPADGVFQSQDSLGVIAARPPRPPLTLSVGVGNTPCSSEFGLNLSPTAAPGPRRDGASRCTGFRFRELWTGQPVRRTAQPVRQGMAERLRCGAPQPPGDGLANESFRANRFLRSASRIPPPLAPFPGYSLLDDCATHVRGFEQCCDPRPRDCRGQRMLSMGQLGGDL